MERPILYSTALNSVHNYSTLLINIPKIIYSLLGRIRDTCLSDPFLFQEGNINRTNIFEYYSNWTKENRVHLESTLNDSSPELGPGPNRELLFVGTELFGVSDFRCSFLRGSCGPIPKCPDIAGFMGLDEKERQTEENKEELKRRYFLAKLLSEQVKYYNDLYVGFLPPEANYF